MAFVSRVRDSIGEDLPNLKIEIENDLGVPMETEDDDTILDEKQSTTSTETEEGELVDDEVEVGLDHNIAIKPKPKFQVLQEINSGRSILTYETPKIPVAPISQEKSYENRNGSFVTGVNIFDPEEQAKLEKRAARFNLDPSESKPLTEKQLKKLYKSMGLKQDDDNVRLEALHMRGTSGMDTQDVFGYFKDYGPASLEWISEHSCNVVWLDDISAARALLGLSVQISDLQPSQSKNHSDSDSDVEMTQSSKGNSVDDENLSEESDAISSSEIPIAIPKGCWRRGAPTPHSKCILLRFATRQDKSAPRTESQFKNFNNPDFEGYVGLISESRKRRMQGAVLNNIIFDDIGDEILTKSNDQEDESNPWGPLAKSWNHFEKLRPSSKPTVHIAPIRLISPPRLRSPPSPPVVIQPLRKKLVARTKSRKEALERGEEAMRRRQSSESEHDESSESDEWSARTKMPRMRMHADDEEIKVEKRRKKDKSHRTRSRSKSPKKSKDLRHHLKSRELRSLKKKESSNSESEENDAEDQDDNEIPDLRIAVAADRDSPEDSKIGIRESLFQIGKVKSVLRGARTHSSGDDEKPSAEEDERRRVRSSVRRHRSRSRERRHHRSQRDGTLHKSSRRHSRTRDDRDLRSTIRRRSPPIRDYDSDEVVQRVGQDLRSKLNKRNKTDNSNNDFRPKSPLQIEIDNDEYYKVIESE